MATPKTVDDYLDNVRHWPAEVGRLHEILAATGLTPTIKWGGPCYTHAGKNVVGLGAFKSYFGLWFHQGAQLGDEAGVLVNAQEGKTRALRQWRMTKKGDIKPALIRRYVREAIRVVDEGREIKPRRAGRLVVPPELIAVFADNAGARSAFQALRPAQRREYAEYVADAKRADTKARRIEKIVPMIVAGVGLNDRYR